MARFDVVVYPEITTVVTTDDYAKALACYKAWHMWITAHGYEGCSVVLWDNDIIIPTLYYSYDDNNVSIPSLYYSY